MKRDLWVSKDEGATRDKHAHISDINFTLDEDLGIPTTQNLHLKAIHTFQVANLL